jgi:hypothetical protein
VSLLGDYLLNPKLQQAVQAVQQWAVNNRQYETVPTNLPPRSTLFRMKRRKALTLLKRFERRLRHFPETLSDYDREGFAAEAVLAEQRRKAKTRPRGKAHVTKRK